MEASARGRAPTSSSCGDARGRRWRRGIGVQWQCPVLNPMPPPLNPTHLDLDAATGFSTVMREEDPDFVIEDVE
ncbi:hypothetical protein PVAP13_6KG077570 [Panicum virgatum]|uniref:Uncharacterized protein n=1 Tax=Panicum virgatum TaxID=38727 RepID=A0A8T0R8P4_PANVG|nr:hypothetical protein PVAP13_6KG077570 [Panicum virgatum]